MKSIMISIQPQYVVDILNGQKTLEIRKMFPSDYVGWVYIYCTKNGTNCYGMPTDLVDYRGCAIYNKFKLMPKGKKVTTDDNQPRLNGKVVARFWCDRVDEILSKENGNFYTNSLSNRKLLTQSCLTQNELRDYMAGNWKQKFGYWYGGYAIHITKLDPFDKPKELKDFYKVGCEEYFTKHVFVDHPNFRPIYERELKQFQIARAPQNYCFIEV